MALPEGARVAVVGARLGGLDPAQGALTATGLLGGFGDLRFGYQGLEAEASVTVKLKYTIEPEPVDPAELLASLAEPERVTPRTPSAPEAPSLEPPPPEAAPVPVEEPAEEAPPEPASDPAQEAVPEYTFDADREPSRRRRRRQALDYSRIHKGIV